MASYGNVAVLASAATLIVPASNLTGSTSDDLRSVLITNNGPNTIYIGNDNAVTTSTGTPVPAGQSLSYNQNANIGIYGRAVTADQVAPADTRWLGEPF